MPRKTGKSPTKKNTAKKSKAVKNKVNKNWQKPIFIHNKVNLSSYLVVIANFLAVLSSK
jgi:hypothetical protein